MILKIKKKFESWRPGIKKRISIKNKFEGQKIVIVIVIVIVLVMAIVIVIVVIVILIVIVLVIVIVLILVIIVKLKRSNFFLMPVNFFLMLIKFLFDALSIFFDAYAIYIIVPTFSRASTFSRAPELFQAVGTFFKNTIAHKMSRWLVCHLSQQHQLPVQ